MLSKIKGELAAAIAVGVAVLLVAGYGITWAGLSNESNEGLPTQVILSALPQSFFISAAVGALILPLVILATLGAGLLAWGVKDSYPGGKQWLLWGIALALYSKGIVLLSYLEFSGVWSGEVWFWSSIVAVAIVVLTTSLGALTDFLLPDDHNRLDRVQLGAAVLIVTSIVAASAFQIAHERFIDKVLPQMVVFLPKEDCPPLTDIGHYEEEGPPDQPDPRPNPLTDEANFTRCSAAGFYIGENDQWIYLARAAEGSQPSRLLFIPRSKVLFAGAATSVLDPDVAPRGQ